MRLALLFSFLAISLAAPSTVHAQEAEGTISGRILSSGSVDRNNSYAILVLPSDIEQPVDTIRAMPGLISVGGEFTVPDLDDGEYLVVLTGQFVEPGIGEESVHFSNETARSAVGGAPPEFYSPAVRVRIVGGLADKEAVFDLDLLRAEAGGTPALEFPTAGLQLPAGADRPLRFPLALAGLGLLSVLAAGALRRWVIPAPRRTVL